MYQQKYEFGELLDVKTILLVLGTLGGAFLGAYFAGKYSIDQTTRQMNHQRDLLREQNLNESLKYSITSLTLLITIRNLLKTIENNVDKEEDLERLTNTLIQAKKLLSEVVNELKSMNIISILSYEMYGCVYKGLNMIQLSLDEVNLLLEYISNTTEVEIKISCADFNEQIKDILGKLDAHINQAKIFTRKEAQDRSYILAKLDE